MTDRYHITLLKNQYLELRQIRLKSDDQPLSFHLIPKTRYRICSLSIRLPIPAIFWNLSAWLACIPDKVHPLGTLKQMQRRALWCHILTGQAFTQPYDLSRHPRRVRRNSQVSRGKRHRGRLGSADEKRLVGRTRGLGSTTEVVAAQTIPEPDTAPNCLKPHPLPGKQRISYPLAAGAKGKRSPRGGGGRARRGRRRRD